MDQGETTKKRKMILQEEEDDEDVKIEKFFALIRSTKDIRDRLLGSHALNLPPKPPSHPAAITASITAVPSADLEPSLEESDFGVMNNGGAVLKLADLNATANHQDTGGGDGCGGGGDCSARLGEDSEIVMSQHQASKNNRSRIVMELDLNLSL